MCLESQVSSTSTPFKSFNIVHLELMMHSMVSVIVITFLLVASVLAAPPKRATCPKGQAVANEAVSHRFPLLQYSN